MNTEDSSSSVKWKSYDATILENLHSHYTKASFCDATILCEGRMFPVHKLILSLSSDYFNDIFSSTPPWNQPYIVITGINATNMDYILTYIYSGEISVSQLELPSFLVAADCLKIKRLDSSSENVHENPQHPSATQKNARFFKQPKSGPAGPFQQSRLANRKMAIVPKPGGNKRQLIAPQQAVKKPKLEPVDNMYLEEEEHHMQDYDVNEAKMHMMSDNMMIKPEHIDPEYEEYEMHHQIPEWEEDHMENEHDIIAQSDELMDPEDSENYFLPVKQEYLDDSYEEYNETNVPQVMTSAVNPSTSFTESITPNAPNMKIHSTSITLHPSSRSNTQDTNTSLNTQRRAVPSTNQSNQKMKTVAGGDRSRQDSIPPQKQGATQFKSKYGPKPFNSSVSINPLVILESNPDEEKQDEENLDDSISSITEIEDPYEDNEELTEEMLLRDPEDVSQSTVYSDSSITISNARNEMGHTSTDESRYYEQSRQWKGISVSQESSFPQQSKTKRQPISSEQISEATRKLPTGSNVKISDARKSGMAHQQQMNNARHQMVSSSSLMQKQMNQRQQQSSGQKQGSGPLANQHISPKQHGMITKFQQHSIPRQQLNVISRPESISSPELRQVNSPVTQQHQRQIAGQRGNKFGVQKQNFAHPSQIPFSKPDSSYERRDSSSPNNSDSGCQNISGGRVKQPNISISSSLSSKIPQCLTDSTSITISQTSSRPAYSQKQRPGPKSKVSQVSRQQAPIKTESPVPKVHSISSSNLPPPAAPRSQTPVNSRSQTPISSRPQTPISSRPQTPVTSRPQTPVTSRPQTPVTSRPQTPVTSRTQPPATPRPLTSAPRPQPSVSQVNLTPSMSRPQPSVSQVNPTPTMARPQPSSTPRLQTTATSRPQPVPTPAPRSGTTTVSKPQPLGMKSQQSPSLSPQHIGSPKSAQQTSDPRSPKPGPKQNQAVSSKPQLSSPKHTVTDSTLPLIEVKQEPAEGAEPYDEQQHIQDLERLFNSGAFGSLPGESPAKPSALMVAPSKMDKSTFLELNNFDVIAPPRVVFPCKKCYKTFSSKGGLEEHADQCF